MAGRTAILRVSIVSDGRDAARGFDDAANAASKYEDSAKRVGKAAVTGATVAVAAIAALGTAAVDAASEAEQAAGAVDAVFGANAAAIHNYAAGAADAVALSSRAYEGMAAIVGAQLQNMGVAQEEVATRTDGLIRLGADLAAQYGGSTKDAVEALSSALKGEMDPLERYAIGIKQADIAARMAADGTDKLEGAAFKQAQTLATLALIQEQAGSAVGAFGRESGTTAQEMEKAKAKYDDAIAALGVSLLPIVADLAERFAGLAEAVSANPGALQAVIGVIGGLAVAVLAIKGAMVVASAATTAWGAAQWLLNAALSANPIGLIVIAIAAVVAILVVAYNKSETFRNIVQTIGSVAGSVFSAIGGFISGVVSWIGNLIARAGGIGGIFQSAMSVAAAAVNFFMSPIRGLISLIQSVIGWISRIRFPSPPAWMSRIFDGTGSPTDIYGVSPAEYARSAGHWFNPDIHAAAGAGSLADVFGRINKATNAPMQVTNVNVTVTGALDPVAVADQIRGILATVDRTRGANAAVVLGRTR